jgi:hypothetical protein
MSIRTTLPVGAAALVLLLTGCSGGAGDEPTTTPSATTAASPSATATADASSAALSDAELASVFTGIQFVPDEFDTTDQLLDSVYPGLTVSDPSCLAPFGVGWDDAAPDGALEFGTSNDRSMTTVVASTGDDDAASALVAEASDALTRCADGTALFTMKGQPVQTTVETTEPTLTGTDESLGWRVTGTVGGGSFTLVGLTARVGGDAVAVVGWDPSSNATNVPLATQMFVDAL